MTIRLSIIGAVFLILLLQAGCVEKVKKVADALPIKIVKNDARSKKEVAQPAKRAKVSVATTFQVRLTSGWNRNGFRFLSLNGSRYSRKILLKQARSEDNQFSLGKDGSLVIRLMNGFEIELAFYPPTEQGHEEFEPFSLDVYNCKQKIISHQKIVSRMKVYRASQTKAK